MITPLKNLAVTTLLLFSFSHAFAAGPTLNTSALVSELEHQIIGQTQVKTTLKRSIAHRSGEKSLVLFLYGGGNFSENLAKDLGASKSHFHVQLLDMKMWAQSSSKTIQASLTDEIKKAGPTVFMLEGIEAVPIELQNTVLAFSSHGKSAFLINATFGQPARFSDPHELKSWFVSRNISLNLLSEADALISMPRPSKEEFAQELNKETDIVLAAEGRQHHCTLELDDKATFVQEIMNEYSPFQADYQDIHHLIANKLRPTLDQAFARLPASEKPDPTQKRTVILVTRTHQRG